MPRRVMVFGVGSFAHAVMTILKESGAEVCCYLTRVMVTMALLWR